MHLRKQVNKPQPYMLEISRQNQSAKGQANLRISRINFGSFLELHPSSDPTAIYLLPILESLATLCDILPEIITQKLVFRDIKLHGVHFSGLLIAPQECIVEL